MNEPKISLRIGDLLVQKGVVSPDQIRIALTEQRKNRDHLGKILVRLGFATEAIILDVFENAAVVKVIGPEWVDYLHMVKWNGRWVIVNVLWELNPKSRERRSRR